MLRRLLIICFLVAGLTACSSKQEVAQKFYERGLAYYERGDYEKARLEFLNAIQRHTTLAEPYYYLGLIAKRDNDIPLAYDNMSKALTLNPDNAPAKFMVTEILLLSREFERALLLATEIRDLDSENIHAMRLQAAALLGLKQQQPAQDLIDNIMRISPDDAATLGLQAVIARKAGKDDQALAFLDRAIATGEDSKQYLMLRTTINLTRQNYKALEQDFRDLIALDPKDVKTTLLLAKLLIGDERQVEAKQLLQGFLRLKPESIEAKRLLITTVARDDPTQGRALLEQFIEQDPSAITLQVDAINQHLRDGEADIALQRLDTILIGKFSDEDKHRIRALKAEVLFQKQLDEEAIALLFENLKHNNQHEASLLLMARYHWRQQQYDSAVNSLRTVLRNNPDSEEGLILLGDVYVGSGSILLADDSYRQALDVNPANANAAMPVARTLMENQDLERADNTIARVLSQRPKDPKLLIFYTQIQLLKRDWGRALLTIDRLRALEGTRAYAGYLAGRVFQEQNQCQQAMSYFREALAINENLVPAMQGLTSCALALDKGDELLSYLEAFKNQHSKALHAYLFSAEIYAAQGNIPSAINTIEKALTLEPQWTQAYIALAGLYRQLADEESVIASYQRGIDEVEDTLYLKTLLAMYQQSRGKAEESALIYREVLAKQPNNSVAANNFAALLLDRDDARSHREALALTQQFKQSEHIQFLDTYGWALLKTGQYPQAEAVLRRAAERAQQNAEVQYHFGVALKNLERFEEARVVFKRSLRLRNTKPDMIDKIATELSQLPETETL